METKNKNVHERVSLSSLQFFFFFLSNVSVMVVANYFVRLTRA